MPHLLALFSSPHWKSLHCLISTVSNITSQLLCRLTSNSLCNENWVLIIRIFNRKGAKRLLCHAEAMLGPRSKAARIFWTTIWYVITPCFTFYVFVTVLMDYSPPKFTNGQPFPPWTTIFGWCMASVSIIPIPLYAALEIWRNRSHLRNVNYLHSKLFVEVKASWVVKTCHSRARMHWI